MSVTPDILGFIRGGTSCVRAVLIVAGLPVEPSIARTTSCMMGAPWGRYMRMGIERMVFASGTRLASNVLVVERTGDVLSIDNLGFAAAGAGISFDATVQNL